MSEKSTDTSEEVPSGLRGDAQESLLAWIVPTIEDNHARLDDLVQAQIQLI